MCGRYSLRQEGTQIAALFGLKSVPQVVPRYNIAPSRLLGTIIQNRDTGQIEWRSLRWGLIPHGAKDSAIGKGLINARSETAAQKRSFRSAIRYRRCLIAADGFYEWAQQGGGKQPHHITLTDNGLFAFAGLWEHWQSSGSEKFKSCAILTTAANELMRTLHNRMPVMLAPQDHARWLDTDIQEVSAVIDLLRPFPAEQLTARPVSTYVNNPRNEGPYCLETCANPLFG